MGVPGIFDLRDRFVKFIRDDAFLLLRIEAETARAILDPENSCGEEEFFFSASY